MTILLTLILGSIALLHALWGVGIWVPIRDEERLVRTVVGAKGVDRMPGPIPCYLVVAAILLVICALWLPQFALARFVLWFSMIVFALRGALAYVPFWRRITPEEPFNTYDQRAYGPLCLGLAAGLLIILLTR